MVMATAQGMGSGGAIVLPPSVVAGRGGVVRFTVDDVVAMVRQGIIREDATTELLNGIVVHKDRGEYGGDPTLHGPRHRACVRRLTRLVGRGVDSAHRHAQIQLPVVCAPDQMPEPDFAIIRGTDADYANRLPTAADTFCVIEVADSSLERDETEKSPTYAAAGIPQYVILNLRTDTAQLYADPDPAARGYRATAMTGRCGTIDLNAGPTGAITVAVDDLLP